MQSTLQGDAKAPQLRPGVHRAIAASENDAALAVELELISVLDGPSFRGSSRSRAFLRFVVEEALAGRQDQLKERTIGVAVLGKPPDYDTGSDSMVRVRANEVRKRLAAHYDAATPKAGVRIELPLGTYAPRFASAVPSWGEAGVAGAPAERAVRPPVMQLWQLAGPTLIAVFLALISIRTEVESSDAFSRFWNQAMAGRTEIVVEVDSQTGGSISPVMADAAMPLEVLASAFQVPVHIAAAGSWPRAGACIIRLSLKDKPASDRAADLLAFRLGGALLFRGKTGARGMWLWAENAEILRSAAQILTSPSGFPEMP